MALIEQTLSAFLARMELRRQIAAYTQSARDAVRYGDVLAYIGTTKLVEGDVITGEANLRAFTCANESIKLTYEDRGGGSEAGAFQLYVNTGSTLEPAWSVQYGDWSYFYAGVLLADRLVVNRYDDDVFEGMLQWDTHSLGAPGALARDYTDAPIKIAPYGANDWRYLSQVKLTKLFRIERGMPGYWVSWYSDPWLGPRTVNVPAQNNVPDFGERELGPGWGAAVAFSSVDGYVARFPEWYDRAEWATAEAAVGPIVNRAFWPGIDDADYSIWTNAAVKATQGPGFPHEQTSGRIWTADLYGDGPLCRFVMFKKRLEVGFWQFAAPHWGAHVSHFTHGHPGNDGRADRFPIFLGAMPYYPQLPIRTVEGRNLEPRPELRNALHSMYDEIFTEWPS